jgi:hypothetical protein
VAPAQPPDREALLQLHNQLLETMFLKRDTTLFAETALPNLIVVPPGGIVENLSQVVNGIANIGAESMEVDDVIVAEHGATAVVVARVATRRAGAAGPGGRGRMMSVFVKDSQRWRLLARSVTPCIEKAVAAGRC